jgi:hypothetical protein
MTRPNARGGIASGLDGDLERRCLGVRGRPRGALVPAQAADTTEPNAHHPVRVERFAFGPPKTIVLIAARSHPGLG